MCISSCILPMIHYFLSLSHGLVPSFLYIIMHYSFSKSSVNFTLKLLNDIMTLSVDLFAPIMCLERTSIHSLKSSLKILNTSLPL